MKQKSGLYSRHRGMQYGLRIMIFVLVSGLHYSCSKHTEFSAQKTELTNAWDTIRPLANPDKGWYHHMLDNGIGKYLIQDEKDLHAFPGMDHLYLRLAWAFLEPEEGKYDWSYIDDIVEEYVPQGYKISFRISCKETGPAPTSVPYEIDGIRYATPYWVVLAGARGIKRPEYGTASWTPDWDDPVYLEKLDNFHKAFAEKYDGQPWVRYVDVGSIGEWGEGHTYFSTRISPTMEEIKTHMNLYMKHYKHSLLVITDDLIKSTRPEREIEALLKYAVENGFSFRDDSPMVKGYIEAGLETWSVSHPEFFEAVYKTRPTVFELEHYQKVKNNGYWLGRNGKEIIPGLNVSGAEIFIHAMELIHPSYIGFHGYLGEWLTDNPELTTELLNRCGYWYFPKSIHPVNYKNDAFSFEIEWLNKGVAPAYHTYQLNCRLIPVDNANDTIDFTIENSGNKKWFPGDAVLEKYSARLPVEPKGKYQFAIMLYDPKSGTPVEMGLAADLKKDNYFVIHNLSF